MSSDGSYGRQMLEDALEAINRLDRAMRGYNGSDGVLTRLSHVERTAKENRDNIHDGLEAVRAELLTLKNDYDMLVSPGEKLKVQGAKWGVVKEMVIVVGVLLSLALSIANLLNGGAP